MKRFIFTVIMPYELNFEVDGKDEKDALERFNYGDFNYWEESPNNNRDWLCDNIADCIVVNTTLVDDD